MQKKIFKHEFYEYTVAKWKGLFRKYSENMTQVWGISNNNSELKKSWKKLKWENIEKIVKN